MKKGDFIDVVVMVYLWITTIVLLGMFGSAYDIDKVVSGVFLSLSFECACFCIYWSIKIGSRYYKRRKK